MEVIIFTPRRTHIKIAKMESYTFLSILTLYPQYQRGFTIFVGFYNSKSELFQAIKYLCQYATNVF